MSRDSEVDRRTFVGVTAAAAAAMFIKPALVHGTHANSAIRVGLLGCGTGCATACFPVTSSSSRTSM